ncbi:MAG: ribosome-associated translation inhibitor RaiA [Actinobacteria bacterium]|nr:MAG: ribosome-associated translation inhibitor RaiA [Actinomycetota bacterium]
MQTVIKGKNIEISDELRTFIEEKTQKIHRHFAQADIVEVECSVEKNPSISDNQVVDVRVISNGPVMKASASSIDIHASLDIVLGKLEKQIEKYKGKVHHNHHGNHVDKYSQTLQRQIIKTDHEMEPMTPNEAVTNMELLGHNFYIFKNADTDQINVVYYRKDKDIGWIEP